MAALTLCGRTMRGSTANYLSIQRREEHAAARLNVPQAPPPQSRPLGCHGNETGFEISENPPFVLWSLQLSTLRGQRSNTANVSDPPNPLPRLMCVFFCQPAETERLTSTPLLSLQQQKQTTSTAPRLKVSLHRQPSAPPPSWIVCRDQIMD